MASTSESSKPPLSAMLFDLRSVIGLLFVVYGLVMPAQAHCGAGTGHQDSATA